MDIFRRQTVHLSGHPTPYHLILPSNSLKNDEENDNALTRALMAVTRWNHVRKVVGLSFGLPA